MRVATDTGLRLSSQFTGDMLVAAVVRGVSVSRVVDVVSIFLRRKLGG
jgi:hypothetical protein